MAFSAPKRRGRRGRAPMADINVTPLVDVMLVLLIIFMVTAPLLNAGVPIDLPDSNAKPLAQEPAQVNLSMSRDGRVYIDQSEVDPGTLADRLAALPRGTDGKPPLVTLRADKTLEYGRVMGVMGELNAAGFNAISLVTNGSVEAP
ncbi:ExbD/TolR family protein [Novosphingobium arvoryzae]|uniref:Protein TolR n=1 Tax=Novosphingobium arvoryzae TaxID=1256514 RepID=A0A918VK97_9SPHN|nr:biopolymer transporter ExbD [Novosphingobium arvoryzae]GHA03202.1 protein TolR [Novosphingobium arvoryzae]